MVVGPHTCSILRGVALLVGNLRQDVPVGFWPWHYYPNLWWAGSEVLVLPQYALSNIPHLSICIYCSAGNPIWTFSFWLPLFSHLGKSFHVWLIKALCFNISSLPAFLQIYVMQVFGFRP